MNMTNETFSFHDTENLDMSPYLKRMRHYFRDMEPLDSGLSPSFPEEAFPVKAVLLDIYGTLLISEAGDIGLTSQNTEDSNPVLIFTNNKASEYPYSQIHGILHDLIRKNQKIQIQKDLSIRYPEIDIITIWQQLYDFIDLKDYSIEDLIQTSLHFEIQTNKISLMPDTRPFLEELKKTGIPIGIVSNAQFYTPVFLEYLLEESLSSLGIDKALSSWSYKLKRGKPDLDIFTTPVKVLNEQYRINANEILYIGNDILNDVYTAAQCGLKTALFAGDKRSLRLRTENPKVNGVTPDCIITELLQILPLIRKSNK